MIVRTSCDHSRSARIVQGSCKHRPIHSRSARIVQGSCPIHSRTAGIERDLLSIVRGSCDHQGTAGFDRAFRLSSDHGPICRDPRELRGTFRLLRENRGDWEGPFKLSCDNCASIREPTGKHLSYYRIKSIFIANFFCCYTFLVIHF